MFAENRRRVRVWLPTTGSWPCRVEADSDFLFVHVSYSLDALLSLSRYVDFDWPWTRVMGSRAWGQGAAHRGAVPDIDIPKRPSSTRLATDRSCRGGSRLRVIAAIGDSGAPSTWVAPRALSGR